MHMILIWSYSSRLMSPSFFMAHWFQFMKPEHSWLCGYPLECGWSTRGHALKENRLSFRSHQVSVSPLLEVGTWDSSPLHAGMFTGLIFCSCCPGNHRSWEIRECNHPAMSREHKVQFSPPSDPYRLSAPLFFDGSWALGRRGVK